DRPTRPPTDSRKSSRSIFGRVPGFREKQSQFGVVNLCTRDRRGGPALKGSRCWMVNSGGSKACATEPALTPRQRRLLRPCGSGGKRGRLDRKSTRLNSSHVSISYAVFCLK